MIQSDSRSFPDLVEFLTGVMTVIHPPLLVDTMSQFSSLNLTKIILLCFPSYMYSITKVILTGLIQHHSDV